MEVTRGLLGVIRGITVDFTAKTQPIRGLGARGQVQLPAINHPTTANWAINQVQESFEQWQNLGFGTTTAAFGNILNSGFGPQAVGQRFL